MKRTRFIAAVSGLILFSQVSAAELSPTWSLRSADGEIVELEATVSKQPVILFFWATWCPYCKALMPHLQSIRLEYGDEVEILAINFREKGDPVGFIKEQSYGFTVLPDGDAVAKMYEIWGTPGVVIIDADLRMRFDLRDLPPYQPSVASAKANHKGRAAFLAPYWAAEIRSQIDQVLNAEKE